MELKTPPQEVSRLLECAGSALNLTPHLHILCIDGVYTRNGNHVRFRNLSSITDDEVSGLVQTIADQIKKFCIKAG